MGILADNMHACVLSCAHRRSLPCSLAHLLFRSLASMQSRSHSTIHHSTQSKTYALASELIVLHQQYGRIIACRPCCRYNVPQWAFHRQTNAEPYGLTATSPITYYEYTHMPHTCHGHIVRCSGPSGSQKSKKRNFWKPVWEPR